MAFQWLGQGHNLSLMVLVWLQHSGETEAAEIGWINTLSPESRHTFCLLGMWKCLHTSHLTPIQSHETQTLWYFLLYSVSTCIFFWSIGTKPLKGFSLMATFPWEEVEFCGAGTTNKNACSFVLTSSPNWSPNQGLDLSRSSRWRHLLVRHFIHLWSSSCLDPLWCDWRDWSIMSLSLQIPEING